MRSSGNDIDAYVSQVEHMVRRGKYTHPYPCGITLYFNQNTQRINPGGISHNETVRSTNNG